VLAVVGFLAFDLCFERTPVRRSLRSPRGSERPPACLDLGRLLDQGAGVVAFPRVDAVQVPVRLEVDPGVQLDGRPVLRPRAMRLVEQPREGGEQLYAVRLCLNAGVVPFGLGLIALVV
jgi:hypothetical protein